LRSHEEPEGRRRFLHLTAGAAALPIMAKMASAQSNPTRPVKIIAPLPAGSAPDIQAHVQRL